MFLSARINIISERFHLPALICCGLGKIQQIPNTSRQPHPLYIWDPEDAPEHNISHFSAVILRSCDVSGHISSLWCRSNRQFWFRCFFFKEGMANLSWSALQICMDVFVSQHFVCQPVKDVKNEKAQGKDSSRNGVDPFGPVHKALTKHFSIIHGHWRGRGEHCCPLQRSAILGLQAVTESVTPEVKTTALPHQFLLLWSQTEEKNRFDSRWQLQLAHGSLISARSKLISKCVCGLDAGKGSRVQQRESICKTNRPQKHHTTTTGNVFNSY